MLELKQFQALTFDCFGTLVDWEAGIAPILEDWARRNGVRADREQLLAAFGEAESRIEAGHPTLNYPDVLRAVMASIADRYSARPDREAADRLANSVGDWPIFSDTVEALGRLQRYYKLAIVSNVDNASFARVRARLGVALDLVVTAEDVASYKPSLRNFEAVLSELAEIGVARDRVLHVAQGLFHDHVPAKEIGLASVWIDRRRGRVGPGATPAVEAAVRPDLVFGSLREFAEAVDAVCDR